MSDLRQQLADLRARVARVDAKFAIKFSTPIAAIPLVEKPADAYVEDWLGGEEVETTFGHHFETEKLYERHRRHGSSDIGSLSDLPHDLLDAISDGATPHAAPEEWAFLDTETTGLAGGTGTCAFLVGVGRITPEGFRVRQFFMRDHAEEASLLDALARHLAPFRVLITYNGRAFDQPLLETRYRLNRARPPFSRLAHLDLLHGARRLWKLRFESCRLVDLETQVLGVERQGDIPG
ncbi:MAG: ribonuclease H-like domain-containing protein, partial [Bryobacteraceae bacterium]